jgi:hypothetical protein
MHKKGITEETAKKRTRRTVKHDRAVVGASWDAIRAKRAQKPEVRAAARQAAVAKSKEAKKAKAATKASVSAMITFDPPSPRCCSNYACWLTLSLYIIDSPTAQGQQATSQGFRP